MIKLKAEVLGGESTGGEEDSSNNDDDDLNDQKVSANPFSVNDDNEEEAK
jgi:hypothetical protein